MNYRRLLVGVLILFVAGIAFVRPTNTLKADDGDQAVKLSIKMDEYNFVVDGQKSGDPIELKINQPYEMTLENTGKLPHEIWWGKDAQMDKESGRLDGYSTNLFESVPVVLTGVEGAGQAPFEVNTPGLEEIALNPGQSMTVEFTLPDTAKGNWEIGCFQPIPRPTPEANATASATESPDVPHYMAGMKLNLTVK